MFDEKIDDVDEPVLLKCIDLSVNGQEFKEKIWLDPKLSNYARDGICTNKELVEYNKISQFIYDRQTSEFSAVLNVLFYDGDRRREPSKFPIAAIVNGGPKIQFLAISKYYKPRANCEPEEDSKIPEPFVHSLKVMNLKGVNDYKVQVKMQHQLTKDGGLDHRGWDT